MAKNSVTDWDETAANNTDVGGTNIDEGCAPSGINNAIRTIMAQVRAFFKANVFRLRDNTDQTKLLAFDLSGITTATTRTLTVPDSSGTIYTDASPVGGFRNKIINGNFDIWQRGTSFTSPGTYTADCWIVGGGGSGAAYTADRGTYSPNDNSMTYALNMTQTAGAAPIYALQKIEDVRTLAGKKVTLTFWARNDTNNPSVKIRIDQEFGSGGSSTVSTIGPTVSITGTHTKYSVTLDMPTIVGKTIGSNSCVSIYIFNADGSPNTFPSTVFVGRVSLVEGDATDETDPFAPREIQQELALCRRYFRKASVPSLIGASATSLDGALDVSDMRTTPTVSMSAPMNVSDVTTTTFLQSAANVSLNGASTDGHLRLSFGNFSGLTLNRPYRHQPNSGLVLLDAGL